MGSIYRRPRKGPNSKTRGRSPIDWLSAVELTDRSSKSPVGEVQTFSATGMTAQKFQVDGEDGYDFQWKGRAHYLALHDLQCRDIETFIEGQAVDRRRDVRGRLTFVPAGCRIWGWSLPAAGRQSFTALYLDPQQMEMDLAKKLSHLPDKMELYFTNAALRATLEKLQRGLSHVARPDALYMESLCLIAMMELCMLRQENTAAVSNPTGRLAKCLEQRLADYVEDHLGQDIGLNDLAVVAGLSRYHFLRAFKRTTGHTPYQFLIQRRIARAQTLLRQSAMSMTEIAVKVGFKDATRFIRAFRGMTGVTPGTYRVS